MNKSKIEIFKKQNAMFLKQYKRIDLMKKVSSS